MGSSDEFLSIFQALPVVIESPLINQTRLSSSCSTFFISNATSTTTSKPPNPFIPASVIANVIFGVMLGLFVVSLIGVNLFVWYKYRSKKSTKSDLPYTPIDLNEPPLIVMQPQKIESVRIRERLGGGHFSDVYLGKWDHSKVALKLFKNQNNLSALNEEIEILLTLSHVNQFIFFVPVL